MYIYVYIYIYIYTYICIYIYIYVCMCIYQKHSVTFYNGFKYFQMSVTKSTTNMIKLN